jgi:hypothetical protein
MTKKTYTIDHMSVEAETPDEARREFKRKWGETVAGKFPSEVFGSSEDAEPRPSGIDNPEPMGPLDPLLPRIG